LDAAGSFMRTAVDIARKGFAGLTEGRREKGGEGGVALSLGPYGAIMTPSTEYSGDYDAAHITRSQLKEWHFKRIGVFLGEETWHKEKVGYVAFETMPRREEIGAVRDVMALVNVKTPWWISCVFPGEGNELPDGSGVRDVVEVMFGRNDGAVPTGIGINCTKIGKIDGLIVDYENAIRELIECGRVEEWPQWLVVYPDGTNGEVYNTATKEWEKNDEACGNRVSRV
jgi:homocysteine S-methyltransferase